MGTVKNGRYVRITCELSFFIFPSEADNNNQQIVWLHIKNHLYMEKRVRKDS